MNIAAPVGVSNDLLASDAVGGYTLLRMTRVYDEIVDFIAGGSRPSDVAAFQPSEESRLRVADLLQRSKLSSLSEDEAAELEHYLELEHIMRLAKARARLHLNP